MPEINTYMPGDLVQLTASFQTLPALAPVDPSSVTITVSDPNLLQSTPAVAHPSVGVFTAEVSPTVPGKWRWRATGTGAAQASADGLFLVAPQTF